MRMRRGRPGRDYGAAAVEFALIMPLFFMLVMGIINYGLWFNDSLTLRQGIRESARQAAVLHTFSGSGCSATTGMDNVACGTRTQILGTSGLAYVKVFAATTWTRGEQVVVCGMIKATHFTDLVPLPADGLIKSKTTMSIENTTPAPSPSFHTDVLPTGDWSWCTA
jgi:Flp pilus assembly protein TadG